MQQNRNTVAVILINNALMTLGFGLWQAIFNNFAVEELGVRADQMGWIQSIREVPGLLGFLVGLLALFLVEIRIAGISAIAMGIGIVLTAVTHDLFGLIAATLFMSLGFHFFFSSNSAALLQTVAPQDGPRAMGRMNSIGAVATVLSTVLIFATLNAWGYRTLFIVAGVAVIAGNLIMWPFARQTVSGARRVQRTPIRRRYWLYYVLQFLSGSRRHIASTFAIFLLVRQYNVIAQVVTLLFLVNSLLGTYLHQAFGQLITRFGERRVLTFDYTMVILVFLAYVLVPQMAFLHRATFEIPALSIGSWVLFPAFLATPALLILIAIVILDHTLIGLAIAIETYMQKIALSPQEITGNLALGQTINHIAAVIIPVAGGIMWEAIGARYTFLVGLGIAVITLVLTTRIRTSGPEPVIAITPAEVP